MFVVSLFQLLMSLSLRGFYSVPKLLFEYHHAPEMYDSVQKRCWCYSSRTAFDIYRTTNVNYFCVHVFL